MEKGHSEEYFKEDRDFWWNHDFLELMARRLRLDECRSLLDVGCGQCHWSRLLVSLMAKPATICALDDDPKWAAGSDNLRQFFQARGATVEFKQGDAHALPYADNSFDVVTCQTTLIHLRNPKAAITEMRRVAKPGGLVLCAEPNNLAGSLVRSNLSAEDPIEDIQKDVGYYLMRERGKALLGEGDNSYGDLLPGDFSDVGFDDIRVYLSDKTCPMYPPYRTPGQQASLQAWQELAATGTGYFDRSENHRYLTALGKEYPSVLDAMLTRFKSEHSRMVHAIKEKNFSTGGACIMYLVSGRKAEQTNARDGEYAARDR